MGETTAFQDRYPGNHCFGCGPDNENGLRLKSHWGEGDETVATFVPSPHHNAGPEIWLNGGIIATVLDCHGIFTAIADGYRRDCRDVGSDPLIWYVTGSLEVSYKRPVPIANPVRLTARVVEAKPRKSIVEAVLASGDQTCVRASMVAVRVEQAWKDGRRG